MNQVAVSKEESLKKALEYYNVTGDMSKFDVAQKSYIISELCKIYKLSPVMRPFDIINFQKTSKDILYLTKSGCDQIANAQQLNRRVLEEVYDEKRKVVKIVVEVSDSEGRVETNVNFFPLSKYVLNSETKKAELVELEGSEYCLAMKKAYSGAMRRATLAFVGASNLQADEEVNYVEQPAAKEQKQEIVPALEEASIVESKKEVEPVVEGNAEQERSAVIAELIELDYAQIARDQIKAEYKTQKAFKEATGKSLEELAAHIKDGGNIKDIPVLDTDDMLFEEQEEEKDVEYIDITKAENKKLVLKYCDELYPAWRTDASKPIYKTITSAIKNTLNSDVNILLEKDSLKAYIDSHKSL